MVRITELVKYLVKCIFKNTVNFKSIHMCLINFTVKLL